MWTLRLLTCGVDIYKSTLKNASNLFNDVDVSIAAMSPGRFQGCSRGVFGLESWEPLRKPGEKPNTPQSSAPAQAEISTERTKVAVGQAPKPSKSDGF